MNEWVQGILLLTAEHEIDHLRQQLVALNRRILSSAAEGADTHDIVYEAADLCLKMASWKGIQRKALQNLARTALAEFLRPRRKLARPM